MRQHRLLLINSRGHSERTYIVNWHDPVFIDFAPSYVVNGANPSEAIKHIIEVSIKI